jgi:hypothetical protein
VGIDVGTSAMHCVVLDGSRRVIDGQALPSDAATELEAVTHDATAIAIDAPSSLSTAPHADDEGLAPKFRLARCCEIALGREHGLWVPWVTPIAGAAVPGWMQVGFGLYQAFAAVGHSPIEAYPHAGFRVLAGGALAPKRTIAGVRARAGLLERGGVGVEGLRLWSHDALDAALAAVLAVRARGYGDAGGLRTRHLGDLDTGIGLIASSCSQCGTADLTMAEVHDLLVVAAESSLALAALPAVRAGHLLDQGSVVGGGDQRAGPARAASASRSKTPSAPTGSLSQRRQAVLS